MCEGLDIKNSRRIVIKINLCDFRLPETGAITHPLFLDALLRYIRERFDDIDVYVVESDATVGQPDLLIQWFGFLQVLKRWNASWCNLTKQKTVRRQINGFYFKEIDVPEIFNDSYFITLAKMKTHFDVKISCALKNQFGCIPYFRKVKYHPHIHDVIVDANLAMRPDFCIVDGIVSMGGVYGPILGVPIIANVIVVGKDPVAVDAVCAKLIGFRPIFIKYLRKAAGAGVGSLKYKIVGGNIKDLKIDFEVGFGKREFIRIMRATRRLLKKISSKT
jgi:uncharacterized protein (DUF362 family)